MRSSTVQYQVRILPAQHELKVEMTLTGPVCGDVLRLRIPTWVPGDYSFAPYARDVFNVRARRTDTGETLAVTRDGWQGYNVAGGQGAVTVTYEATASATESAEPCGIVDSEFAVLLGARYLYSPDHLGPCRVTYRDLPAGWAVHHPSGAQRVPGADAWDYPSYELLLDTPVVLGKFDRRELTVKGTTFYFVFVDRGVGFETEVSGFVQRLADVAGEFHEIFGSFPFADYTFVMALNPLCDWGLEHLSSSMCGVGPEVFIDDDQTAYGVRVCAHELFHAWNVRRLRPAPLKLLESRLDQGCFTEGLWLAEGFTRYYEFLVCARTGVYTAEQFFSSIVGYYQHLSVQTAYQRVSGADSSLATYLNHDKYSGRCNNSIDYYDKGMLIAFTLDAVLRMERADYTLDRAFREFYAQYVGGEAGYPGYTTADVLAFFARILPGLREMLAQAVQQPAGLAIPATLEKLGFRVNTNSVNYLGLVFMDDGAPAIYDVLDSSPAGASGIAPADVLTRVNGYPFSLKALKWVAARTETVTLEVLRGHRTLTFAMNPAARTRIVSLNWNGQTPQAQRIATWLKQPFAPTPDQPQFSLDFYENFHGIETVV